MEDGALSPARVASRAHHKLKFLVLPDDAVIDDLLARLVLPPAMPTVCGICR